MNSVIIARKLSKYLEQMNLPENRRLITILSNDSPNPYDLYGFCFGFSVSHAAMSAIHKMDWWEHALVAVANWDEEKKTLIEKINLPESFNNEPVELETIFKRVLDYIIYAHAHSEMSEFRPFGVNQRSMLSPNSGNFEILDGRNENDLKIRSIEGRRILAGCLSDKQIEQALDQSFLEGSICLVHSVDHTCNISYEDNKWILYDSRKSDPTSIQTIHKEFTTKEDLIHELISDLGSSLAIEIASFSENEIPLAEINQFSEEELISCLNLSGLHQIIWYTPEKLDYVFEMAKKSEVISEQILKAFAIREKETHPAFDLLIQISPQHIDNLLQIARKSKHGPFIIAKLLAKQNGTGWSGLQRVAREMPEKFNEVLAIASNTPKGAINLVQALASKNRESNTGLDAVIKFVPDNLSKILDMINNSPEACDNFGKVLLIKNQEGFTGLQILASHAPEQLDKVLDIMSQSKNGPDHLARAFFEHNNGDTGLKTIAALAPTQLSRALDLIGKSAHGPHMIARALGVRSNTGWTGLHTVARYAPDQIKKVLEVACKDERREDTITQTIAKKNKNDATALLMIVRYAPYSLNRVLEIIEKTRGDLII